MKKLTDQIKEKLDEGITAIASTISNEPQELVRIKNRIKQLGKKKEELLLLAVRRSPSLCFVRRIDDPAVCQLETFAFVRQYARNNH